MLPQIISAENAPAPVAPLGDAPPDAAGAPALRFCGACGAAQAPSGAEPCPCAGTPGPGVRMARSAAGGAADSVTHSLALYFSLLGISLLGAGLASFIPEHDVRSAVLTDFGVTLAMSTAVVVAFLSRRREVLPALRPPAKDAARWYLLAALLAPLTFGLAMGSTFVLSIILGTPILGYAQPILDAGYGWPVIVLVICVWPAVFEELAFRGFMLSALGRVLHAREAVIVTSMLFMLLHLAPLSFAHLLVIGLALGFLRVKSGSLYPAMLLHFLHNFLVIASEYFLGIATMLVEHSFVTVREMNDAFSDAADFLGSIGFEPPQLVPPSAMQTRRGLRKAGRGTRISAHPQQLRLEFDRGRIMLGASVQVIGKPRPTHRAMLTSIAQGLELLLAEGADAERARRPVEDAQRAIIKEHRRQRLVHNTVVSVVVLCFLALIGALAYAMVR